MHLIGGSEVCNISLAIHPHTLFLMYAHGDQLTHRPFFLLSVVVDLKCFKRRRKRSDDKMNKETITDFHFQPLQLIGHVIHHHDVLANAAPPIILSCHQLENKGTSVCFRRPLELRLHRSQVGFSIFRIRNSSPDSIVYRLLHKHETHAVTPSPLFMKYLLSSSTLSGKVRWLILPKSIIEIKQPKRKHESILPCSKVITSQRWNPLIGR
ncbi:hypothetical protein Hanom_Chr07g00654431 [Helianthus anomalus]